MRGARGIGALLVLIWAGAASAQINSSPIPEARPGGGSNYGVSDLGGIVDTGATSAPAPNVAPSAPVVTRSPRPLPRPNDLAEKAQAQIAASRNYGTGGSVCGVNAIKGKPMTAIPGRVAGCGVDAPVKVTEIAGITLSTAATMDCTTAKALYTWVEKGAKPAIGRYGGGLRQLNVAASYACRPRNNQVGAKISEHGRGRAVDISGFVLKNGETITLLQGWGQREQGKILRKMHKAACGPFGTVLGPDANRYHLDHFHFDTARYRSGSYCR